MTRLFFLASFSVCCVLPVWSPDATSQEVTHATFKNPRFMEDWSYLSDSSAATDHWYPGVKQVELPNGWTADFGGQFRYRFHREFNLSLKDTSPRHNNFHLWRTRVHGDFRNGNGTRVFVELLDARVHGNDKPPRGIDANNTDFLNAFVEFRGNENSTVRIGRADLLFGAQRLISPLDWANTRRLFDGVRVDVAGDGSNTSIFATRPILVDARDLDSRDGSKWFTGVYHTRKVDSASSVDLFALKLNAQDSKFPAGSAMVGDLDLYTAGARYWGKAEGGVDYDAWGATQFGDRARQDVDAYAWSVNLGKTFPESQTSPRVGLTVDYASGDSNPTDSDVTTFHQLFPLGHKYFGAMDLVGRQNIVDVQPNLTLKLSDRVKLKAELHMFNLAKKRDALYNAGGGKSLQDATGGSGRNVGREIDLALIVTPEQLAPHGKVVFGYSRFSPGSFVDRVGDSTRADFFFAQFLMTF